VISEGRAEVETEGTMMDTLRLNLLIRTGQRILFLLDSFNAKTPDELYKRISWIGWEDYISENGYFSVTSSVHNPTIKDSRYPNVKCKDAVVDRIKEKCGRRPDTGPEETRSSFISTGGIVNVKFSSIPPGNLFPGVGTE